MLSQPIFHNLGGGRSSSYLRYMMAAIWHKSIIRPLMQCLQHASISHNSDRVGSSWIFRVEDEHYSMKEYSLPSVKSIRVRLQSEILWWVWWIAVNATREPMSHHFRHIYPSYMWAAVQQKLRDIGSSKAIYIFTYNTVSVSKRCFREQLNSAEQTASEPAFWLGS